MKFLRALKNVILKGITGAMFLLFCLSACAMDSPDLTYPMIGCLVSIGWLFLFGLANGAVDW